MTSKGSALPRRISGKPGCADFNFADLLAAGSALALLAAPSFAQTLPSSAWSPPEMAPAVSAHERLPFLHPDAFLWRKPAPGTGQNTRTAAIALGEFDTAPGPDLISVQDDGTLMLSRNWELNLGEPTPPRPLPVTLPHFLWDPRHVECEVFATPLRLDANDPRHALAILTQAPPQLVVIVDPAVAPIVRIFPILPITPRALQAIDLDRDGKDELFWLQSHRFETQPVWFRYFGFAYLFGSNGLGVSDGFELGTASSPLVDFALRDLDRDGDADLVLAETGRFHVWYQTPSGGMALVRSSPVQPFAIEQLRIGDVDGDRALDIALRGARNVRAFFHGSARYPQPDLEFDTSFASWIAGAQGAPPPLTDFALQDLEGDGVDDLLLSLAPRTCLVAWRVERGGRLAGAPNGRRFHGYTNDQLFPTGATWLRENSNGKLVLGDVDLDGDVDAYLSNPSASHLIRFTNRARHESPTLHSIDVPYAALRAGGSASSAVTVSFEYEPHPSFRVGQAMMIYRLYRQTPQGFDPMPIRTWAGPATPGRINVETFPLQRRWWSENERLALLVSSFHPPIEHTAAVFRISGALDRGGQQSGNGTTSCPDKHEQIVWETEYAVSCREGSNIRRTTGTRQSGPTPSAQ